MEEFRNPAIWMVYRCHCLWRSKLWLLPLWGGGANTEEARGWRFTTTILKHTCLGEVNCHPSRFSANCMVFMSFVAFMPKLQTKTKRTVWPICCKEITKIGSEVIKDSDFKKNLKKKKRERKGSEARQACPNRQAWASTFETLTGPGPAQPRKIKKDFYFSNFKIWIGVKSLCMWPKTTTISWQQWCFMVATSTAENKPA